MCAGTPGGTIILNLIFELVKKQIMRLMPLNDNVLNDLLQKGYSDIVLKSRIHPGQAAYFQEIPIEVYEAHQGPEGDDCIDLVTLKEHIHLHSSDCYVIISD